MSGATLAASRLERFLQGQLGPSAERRRAFLRTLIGVLLATVAVQILRPANPYWTVTFALIALLARV